MQRRGGSFFGRRKGKALRPGQRAALDAALPALLVNITVPPPADLAALFPKTVHDVRIEIGFGGGEHLTGEAFVHPDTGFIGIEPFENGLAKAVTAIMRDGIRNVRLFNQDAALLLDWLPPDSVSRIDLLFPDPWPKKRHWKRRFVNGPNLERIAASLRDGGMFRFATDVEDYAAWTRDAVARSGCFTPVGQPDAERTPWEGWPGSRYERKALAAGRTPLFLEFRKPGQRTTSVGKRLPARDED